MSAPENPYLISNDAILEPPVHWWERLKFLGPGLILTASIVGSGELITTTLLGAQAGFVCFWVILVSCLVKVAVQVEFGKNAIYSGRSTMLALNGLPGPRFGRANWSIWLWLLLMLPKMLQVGGIVGGVAMVCVEIWPSLQAGVLVWPVALLASVLVWKGGYTLIERLCVILICLFTLFTVASLISLQFTDYSVSAADVASGLTFTLPQAALLVAVGAFGITGIGGDEIMAYNYWLIEKGYAKHTGQRQDSADWERRARGWIQIMKWDALVSMVVYTLVTIVFYLLGAAVLHRQGLVPESSHLISTLSLMYTESLGKWAGGVFLAGAFVVLFSTVIAALGAWTRMFSDAFAQIGLLDFRNTKQRQAYITALAFIIPVCWVIAFLYYRDPAFMVVLGGVVTVVILWIVAFAAAWFRYRELPAAFKPGWFYDAWLWASIAAICLVGVFGAAKAFGWL
jgi:Mn2+/Fe2+ NRAMP family transporter